MLYKIVAMAAFLVSADALKIDASGMSRRVILGNAAALAPALIAAPSFAALMKQSDGEIYKRAECVAKTPSNTIELPGCCHQPHTTHHTHTPSFALRPPPRSSLAAAALVLRAAAANPTHARPHYSPTECTRFRAAPRRCSQSSCTVVICHPHSSLQQGRAQRAARSRARQARPPGRRLLRDVRRAG